jgi:hypothetical protein
VATRIHAIEAGRPLPEATACLPTVEDGMAGMNFIEAVAESHATESRWVSIKA